MIRRAPLSQVQIIRSLGEALGWLERELEWGAPVAELRHLTGRIGELYAAMLTRGQMATAINQRGYDVVSGDGDRVSVKTVTTSGRATFNPQTLELVDRIMVFRINIDEEEGVSIETLLDIPETEFEGRLRHLSTGEIDYPIRPHAADKRPLTSQSVVASATLEAWTIKQYESGTIEVECDGAVMSAAMPTLREIAARIGVDLLNSNGQPRNTRQLGAAIIDILANLR